VQSLKNPKPNERLRFRTNRLCGVILCVIVGPFNGVFKTCVRSSRNDRINGTTTAAYLKLCTVAVGQSSLRDFEIKFNYSPFSAQRKLKIFPPPSNGLPRYEVRSAAQTMKCSSCRVSRTYTRQRFKNGSVTENTSYLVTRCCFLFMFFTVLVLQNNSHTRLIQDLCFFYRPSSVSADVASTLYAVIVSTEDNRRWCTHSVPAISLCNCQSFVRRPRGVHVDNRFRYDCDVKHYDVPVPRDTETVHRFFFFFFFFFIRNIIFVHVVVSNTMKCHEQSSVPTEAMDDSKRYEPIRPKTWSRSQMGQNKFSWQSLMHSYVWLVHTEHILTYKVRDTRAPPTRPVIIECYPVAGP
jgi:hypothetical protein